MTPELRIKLQALGAELSPSMMQGTNALLAAVAAPRDPAVAITRDVQYGSDARNRLDIFRKGQPAGAPVLVYVHGGGFVMGDKTSANLPFYENFGQWAAQQGWLGVTMTYRLAPAHQWPSGPEDMALAVRWLRGNVAQHGGDPRKIFLIGQSAGGAHVAAYVSQPRFHPDGAVGLAGAVMISGIYDAVTQPANQFNNAYYGEGDALRSQACCIPGLAASPLPLLFTISEFDPLEFQQQAMQLARAWQQHSGRYPPIEYLAGHNHMSPAQSIGSGVSDVDARIARFVATFSGS